MPSSGYSRAELRADERLDLAVGVGDEVLVALAFDGQRIEGAEIGQTEIAGADREFPGKAQARLIVIGHAVSASLKGSC